MTLTLELNRVYASLCEFMRVYASLCKFMQDHVSQFTSLYKLTSYKYKLIINLYSYFYKLHFSRQILQ